MTVLRKKKNFLSTLKVSHRIWNTATAQIIVLPLNGGGGGKSIAPFRRDFSRIYRARIQLLKFMFWTQHHSPIVHPRINLCAIPHLIFFNFSHFILTVHVSIMIIDFFNNFKRCWYESKCDNIIDSILFIFFYFVAECSYYKRFKAESGYAKNFLFTKKH